jgi:hypothetical protein
VTPADACRDPVVVLDPRVFDRADDLTYLLLRQEGIWYDEYRVHVEIDGGQHLEVRAAWADMKRQNDLWIAGARILRFPAWLVRARPGDVVAQVRAALLAGGWRTMDLGCPVSP